MRIAVAGSHGLIGSALVDSLRRSGHEVSTLVRRPAESSSEISWNPETAGLASGALDGFAAVVNLGGVGISRRWTGRVKQELRDSRVIPTTVLAEAVTNDGVPTFVSASATGFYGDTGDVPAVEGDDPGSGFLADLAVDWEAAADTARPARVVNLRTAPVLSPKGGLLGRLRPLYRLGLGGPIGSGEQYFSWISLSDEIGAITHVLSDRKIRGPVNLSAPQAVPYREFSAALARKAGRPHVMRVPAPLARKVGGEMVEEMILGSSRVVPDVLTSTGFTFAHPTVSAALEYAGV